MLASGMLENLLGVSVWISTEFLCDKDAQKTASKTSVRLLNLDVLMGERGRSPALSL